MPKPMDSSPLAGAPSNLTQQSGASTKPRPDAPSEKNPNSAAAPLNAGSMPEEASALATGYTPKAMNKVPDLAQDREQMDQAKIARDRLRQGLL